MQRVRGRSECHDAAAHREYASQATAQHVRGAGAPASEDQERATRDGDSQQQRRRHIGTDDFQCRNRPVGIFAQPILERVMAERQDQAEQQHELSGER